MKDSPLMLLLPVVLIMGAVGFMFAQEALSPVRDEVEVVEEEVVNFVASTSEEYREEKGASKVDEKISISLSATGSVEVAAIDSSGFVSTPNKDGEITLDNAYGSYKVEVAGPGDEQYELRIVAVKGRSLLYSTEVVARSKGNKVDSYLIEVGNNKVSVEDASYVSLLTSIPANDVYESCSENDRYYVVGKKLDYVQPTNIYVYKKNSVAEVVGECRKLNREPYFVMKLEDASYLRQIVGDVLLIDTGTGPARRGISGISLLTQEKVFSDSYGSDVVLYPPHSIGYWTFADDIVATPQNCAEIKKIEESYLTPSIQQYLVRNVVTGELERGDFRCVATQ